MTRAGSIEETEFLARVQAEGYEVSVEGMIPGTLLAVAEEIKVLAERAAREQTYVGRLRLMLSDLLRELDVWMGPAEEERWATMLERAHKVLAEIHDREPQKAGER